MDEEKRQEDIFENGRFSGGINPSNALPYDGELPCSFCPIEEERQEEDIKEEQVVLEEADEVIKEQSKPVFEDTRFFDPGMPPGSSASQSPPPKNPSGPEYQPYGGQTVQESHRAQKVLRQENAAQDMGGRKMAGCDNCAVVNNRMMTVALTLTITSFAVLLIAFLAVLFTLTGITRNGTAAQAAESAKTVQTEESSSEEEPVKKGKAAGVDEILPDQSKQQDGNLGGAASGAGAYGEIEDAIRDDLSYGIEWVNYEYEGNNEFVELYIDYPEIVGDVPNQELINQEIKKETEYFEEFILEYSKYMLQDEVFYAYVEGFITYMDEDTMSIVFNETMYTDYWTDQGLFCINIDMENGVILDNQSIIDIDEEFSIDFRKRSKDLYGDESVLDYMTDQEVVYYLTEPDIFIIFYTPAGLEIGLNYGESYTTVTYEDYEKFLKTF